MKKILFAAAALAALTISSCTKELDPGQAAPEKDGTVISLTIAKDALVKSAFDGEKVALSGNEDLRICYVDGENKVAGSVKATGTDGNYTFTLPDGLNPDDYSWYAAAPWKQSIGAQAGATDLQKIEDGVLQMRLPSVQLPGANTFDPYADELISKSFTISEGSATVDAFKRVSAPLLVKVTGLEDGEKIFAANLKANSSNGLVSRKTITLSDSFDEAGVAAYSGKVSNVAAIWQDGLAKAGDFWPVWLCVNNTEIEAGADLTLTVTTGTRTITRTVQAQASEFKTNRINTITFNVLGNGYVEKTSVVQGFTTLEIDTALGKTGNHNFIAGDGNEYNWKTWRSNNATGAAGYAWDGIVDYSLQTSAYSGTFKGVFVPSVPGFEVKGVTAYLHPASISTTHKLQLYPADAVANGDAAPVVEKTLNGTFGYVEAPEEVSTLAGLKLSCNSTINIAMAVLYIEEITVESNDYKEIYDAGGNITIGDLVINNSEYPSSEVIMVEHITTSSFDDAKKVIFVDNTNQNEIELGDANVNLYGIVIGRYKDSQPSIISKATENKYFRTMNGTAVKNVCLKIGADGMFTPCTSGSGATTSVNFEDCTIIYTGNNQVFRESQTAYCFNDITVKNSIIQTNAPLLGNNGTARTTEQFGAGMEGTLTFINNVIMPVPGETSVTSVNKTLIDARASACEGNFEPFKLIMKNNTVYYFRLPSSGGIVTTRSIGGIELDSNLIYTDVYSTDSNNTRIIKCYENQPQKPEPVSFTNNWANKSVKVGTTTDAYIGITNSNTPKYWNSDDHNKALPYTDSGNSWKNTVNPFLESARPLDGYLPVDPSVTTAGATYATKKWKNWTKVNGGSESFQ